MLQNVQIQNAELQNIEIQNFELQNFEWIKGRITKRQKLKNIDSFRTSKYKTSNPYRTSKYKKKHQKYKISNSYGGGEPLPRIHNGLTLTWF